MTSMDLNNLAAVLFDSFYEFETDAIVVALIQVDPSDLLNALSSERSENRSWGDKVRFPTEYCEEVGEAIIQKLADAKDSLVSDEYNKLIDFFRPTAEISVLSGEVWQPRILPNGAILIRNHHRVIAIDEAPSYSNNISFSISKCMSDLCEIAEAFKVIQGKTLDSAPILFNIIHHGPHGIKWTEEVPSSLNLRGQSVVFMSNLFIEALDNYTGKLSADNMFIASEIRDLASSSSRSGHAVIRIFESGMYAYGTFRSNDEYDTILENHSLFLGELPDGEALDADCVSTDYKAVVNFCRNNLEANFPHMLVINEGESDNVSAVKQQLSSIFLGAYASEKASQIAQFPAFFTNDPSIAASYIGTTPTFASILNDVDSDLLVANVYLYPIKSRDDFDNLHFTFSNFALVAVSCAEQVGLKLSDTFLYTTGMSAYDDEIDPREYKLYPLDSDDFKDACSKLRVNFLKRLGDDYEDFDEGLYDIAGEFNVYIVLGSREYITPIKAHEFGLRFSEIIDNCPSVQIPSIGYYQGYDCGDLDTGNVNVFVNEQDQSSVVDSLH